MKFLVKPVVGKVYSACGRHCGPKKGVCNGKSTNVCTSQCTIKVG